MIKTLTFKYSNLLSVWSTNGMMLNEWCYWFSSDYPYLIIIQPHKVWIDVTVVILHNYSTFCKVNCNQEICMLNNLCPYLFIIVVMTVSKDASLKVQSVLYVKLILHLKLDLSQISHVSFKLLLSIFWRERKY